MSNLPGIELKSVVIPSLSEVTINTEDLLELVDGPDVLNGEVELHLGRRPVAEVVRPDLLVVAAPLQQVIQRVRHLERHRGSRPGKHSGDLLLTKILPVKSCSFFTTIFKISGVDNFVGINSFRL